MGRSQTAIEFVVKPGRKVVTQSFAKIGQRRLPVLRTCAMVIGWWLTGRTPIVLNPHPMRGRLWGCEAQADGPIEYGSHVSSSVALQAEVML